MDKALKKIRTQLLYFLALFTQAKAFCDNPIIGNRWLNRMGLHVMRVIVAHAVIRFRQIIVALMLGDKISRQDKQHYLKYGFIIKYDVLESTTFEGLRKEFSQHINSCADEQQGNTQVRSLLLTQHTIASAPYTDQATKNASLTTLLQFASGYFLRPWFYFLRIIHNLPDLDIQQSSIKPDPQKSAHADAFHPTMKAWLFIDDVNMENGPFNYYAGSHKLSFKRLKWEYWRSVNYRDHLDGYSERGSFRPTELDKKQLGINNPRAFTVPKNTLIIANTYGFHFRGQGDHGATRDALWISSWRAPFLPIPLPNWQCLARFFEKRMSGFIRNRVR